jgi:hypothetical protein
MLISTSEYRILNRDISSSQQVNDRSELPPRCGWLWAGLIFGEEQIMKKLIILVLGLALCAGASSLLVNGDFELGNVGFTSSYVYVDVANAPIPNMSLYPEGTYGIVTSPNLGHNLWANFGDHTSGAGNMMAVNGKTSTSGGDVVWQESVSGLTPGATYYFRFWSASIYFASPADLYAQLDSSALPGHILLTSETGLWTRFQTSFTADATGTATLGIYDLNLVGSGNDFALDDISLVPEPATIALFGLGLIAVGLVGRKRFTR